MNKELLEAMEVLEKEKNISKDTMIEAIENSLITACKNNFGKADNVKVVMNRTTGDFAVYAEKTVVEEVEDPVMEISLADARMISAKYQLGDTVQVPLDSKNSAVSLPRTQRTLSFRRSAKKSARHYTMITTPWKRRCYRYCTALPWKKYQC